MHYWYTIDEGHKHYNKQNTKDLNEEAKERHKATIPKERQIECPNCKTLNEPNSVLCVSCGENMLAIKQVKIKDYGFLHKAHKRRKH